MTQQYQQVRNLAYQILGQVSFSRLSSVEVMEAMQMAVGMYGLESATNTKKIKDNHKKM